MVTWPYHISTGKPQLLDTTDASRVPGGWRWPWCCWQQQLQRLAKLALPTYFAWLLGRLAMTHCSNILPSKTKESMCTHLDSGAYHHPDDCSRSWGWGGPWVLNWHVKLFRFWWNDRVNDHSVLFFCVWKPESSNSDKQREHHWSHLLMLTTPSEHVMMPCFLCCITRGTQVWCKFSSNFLNQKALCVFSFGCFYAKSSYICWIRPSALCFASCVYCELWLVWIQECEELIRDTERLNSLKSKT